MSITKTFHLHILAQHVARAFLVVSIIDELYFTFHSFHLRSSPTFYTTINQISIDLIFTRRLYLRRFIEFVFRSCAGIDLAYSLWSQQSHWSQLYGDEIDVLPHAEHDVDLWYIREHCDTPSWIGFGWWSNSEICWLHRCTSGERSRCWLTRSLSLFRANSVSSSSPLQESAGKLAAVFSHKRKLSQDTFSDSESISSRHQTVQSKGESFFRFSHPEEAVRLAREQQRDNKLAEEKSENLPRSARIEESSGKCELTNSPYINWDKVTLQHRSSLHKYRSCRREWITFLILENFKM